jgi:hypothetical protein
LKLFSTKKIIATIATNSIVKVNWKMFEALAIAAKKRCGRTKAENLLKKLLGPWSIEVVLDQIRVSDASPLFILFLLMLQTSSHEISYP